MNPRKKQLSKKEVLQLAAEAQVDWRTVVRVYDGNRCWPTVRERLVKAAKKLEIVSPPQERA